MPLQNNIDDREDRPELSEYRRRSTTTPTDNDGKERKDLWMLALPNHSNESSDEEDEGYDTDYTSSYDSDDGRYSRMFAEIAHGKTAPTQHISLVVPGLGDGDKRRKLNTGEALSLSGGVLLEDKRELRSLKDHTGKEVVCRTSAKSVSLSPFLVSHSANFDHSLVQRPEVIGELFQAISPFYKEARAGSSSDDIAPLLEQGLREEVGGGLKKHKSPSRASENVKTFPRPAAEADSRQHALNDMESNPSRHIVPSPSSPAFTTTFGEALASSENPRLITLSFPPFFVVHANNAFCNLTGYSSNEILGLPLHRFLAKECQEKFQGSVTAMHDRLVSIASKQEVKHSRKCFIKISLVGPEAGPWDQEKDGEQVEEDDDVETSEANDTQVYVTHYAVELEPISGGRDKSVDSKSHMHLVSPELSTFCVLG